MNRALAWIAAVALASTGCSVVEVERETGYKGRARVNPWLAAEKFAESYGFEVVSTQTWQEPVAGDTLWFMPGSLLENQLFVSHLETWLDEGGHLVVLLENAEAATNDWGYSITPPIIQPPLRGLIERAGIRISDEKDALTKDGRSRIEYQNRSFRVNVSPSQTVQFGDGEPSALASVRHGGGRLTVLVDASIFRNRWIDTHEHAELLAAMMEDAEPGKRVGFIRGSGLSFWKLLGETFWPVLIALGAWLVFWLWRSFGRFGPLEAADEPTNIRGYDTHLEALGGYNWELDRAAGLLQPIRARILEHAHHQCARAGRAESELHDFLAARTDLTVERVARALTATPPKDAASLTRLTADLQKLLHIIP